MKKTTRKIIKRIIGWAILAHIIPGIILLYVIAKGKIDETGYWAPYVIGLKTDAVIVLLFIIFIFIVWCFSGDDY